MKKEVIGPPPAAIDRLTVKYGKKTVCAEVSLAVAPGAVYALLGRNGAGKTSIVRCLLGQQKPRSGRAMLFGEDCWTSRRRAMERVGVVPEEPDAPPAMTPAQLSRFCGRLHRRWDAAAVAGRLARAGISQDTPFRALSKGEKSVTMLALALGHTPELLVLDDPTLGLDAVSRRGFYEELVGELADRGATVFLTTHDLAGVEGIATRVGILQQGHLLLDEDVESVKARFRRIRYGNRLTETRTAFGTELDDFDAVRVKVRGWGVDAIVSNFEEERFDRFQAMDGVVDAEIGPMSLEEIFVAVTGPGSETALGAEGGRR